MVIPPEITHHTQIPEKFKLLGVIQNPLDADDQYWFLKYEDILIIFSGGDWVNRAGETKYSFYQACFPMEALTWVMKMFNFFFTPPKDGGLAAGKIATTDQVDGEKLMFTRGMCVGGPDHGGYMLENLSRVNYGEKLDSMDYQGFDFPDPFLFDGGLMEFWQDLAAKYERGEFD